MLMTDHWPAKYDVFGVRISAVDYNGAVAAILVAAKQRRSAAVDLMPVHGLITAARDQLFRQRINEFDMVAPDGQPVRWALNRFHGLCLKDRVYGPFLTLHVCQAAAEQGVGVYLYGSTPEVLQRFEQALQRRYSALKIVGAESPPFRSLTPEEHAKTIERINASGAGIVLLGLGCPRQEVFAHENLGRIRAVQLCVGAAFDFHAGNKRMAPTWMQKRGLEWLFRLISEPRRLWRRYLVTNSLFVFLFTRRLLLGR